MTYNFKVNVEDTTINITIILIIDLLLRYL